MGQRVKSLVLASLEKVKLGDYDEALPLHVTVVPPFTHERLQTGNIARRIGEKLNYIHNPFHMRAREDAMFGDHHDLPVRKVGSGTLHVIHNMLIDTLKKIPDVDLSLQYALGAYNPHSTYKGDARMSDGLHLVDTLYLAQKTSVEGLPPSWYIAAEYQLGDRYEATT